MIVQLEQRDLINLVKAVRPNNNVWDEGIVRMSGDYSDLRGWRWDDDTLRSLTEKQLYGLYRLCVLSWTTE